MTETRKLHEIELRDLEPLLRKKLGNDLVLVNYSAESLLPPGENYGSTILKVRAVLRRQGQAEEEELNLVAKMLPPTDFQRMIFDSPYTFRKEAFLYQELISSYRQLERDFGVKDDEVFDIVPEFYGARFSLNGDEDFDDDAVILMQNLKVLGYYTGDRRQGLDFEHAKVAIIALSRFHALGMAMKHHRPDYFEFLKVRSKCLEFNDDSGFEDSNKIFLRVMHEDPETSCYAEHTEAAMLQESAKTWTATPSEPWSTIVHADFWVNNIMFRRDGATNRVDDVKFVDFQNYLFLSPLRELTFFVMASLDAEIMTSRFEELLDLYYENLIKVLRRMNCDVKPFTRDKFDERLKIDAFEEFPHCPFMLKVMTADVKEDEKFDSSESFMKKETLNERFKDRLRRCVKKYAEKGWLFKESK